MKQILKSTRIVTPNGVRPASVAFEKGRIVSIDEFCGPAIETAELIDVGDLYVLPGIIDTHVHLNEPGRTEWEGFDTGTRAAVAGGCTCVVDMPLNSVPAVTHVQALEQKREAARCSCFADYAFWGGVVQGNASEILPLAHAGVRGFKCFLVDPGVPEFTHVTEADLDIAVPLVAKSGLPLLVHAEVPGPIENARTNLHLETADWREPGTYLQSRPQQAEIEAIELMIRLCRKHGCRVHIVHLSSAGALPILEQARADHLPITVETCPHYLHFSCERIPAGATQYKCAPPIREDKNRDLLWGALGRGLIDLIASDHSPCPPALKCPDTGDFFKAWGGIASISLALPAIWREAGRRGFQITDVVRWMCERPAVLAGLQSRKGRIAPGLDADFTVFDPDKEFEVTPDRLHFHHTVSPYIGERLRGEVQMTFTRGHCVFANGEFAEKRPGQECLP